MEAPDELQIKTVTQQGTKPNLGKPNQLVTFAKSQATTGISDVNSNETRTKLKTTQIMLVTSITTTVVKQAPTPTTRFHIIPTQKMQTTEKTENQELSSHPVTPVVKPSNPQRNVILEPMQPIHRLPGTENRKHRIRSNKEAITKIQKKVLKLQPDLQTKNAASSHRNCELHLTNRRQP